MQARTRLAWRVGVLSILVLAACNDSSPTASEPEEDDERPDPVAVTVTMDRQTRYQEIDEFGFFGARTVWWTGDEDELYTEAWADRVIHDLGITIWRNEYYPPSIAQHTQDADWEKQRPVVKGLYEKAQEHNVDLKFVFTVWSPPASMKVRVDEDDNRHPDTPHPGGTKEGGTLDPDAYEEFGEWLADGVQLYKDLGIDLYALSPQNEPLFKQPFNSCYYRPAWYADMVANSSIPGVKDRFPDVKVFGAENMLEMEGGDDRVYFYHEELNQRPEAIDPIDIVAVHGYTDGVLPTSNSNMARLWSTFYDEYAVPAEASVWMTETSGYHEEWDPSDTSRSGGLDLALAMHFALHDGQASAWTWWQGSGDELSEYTLMDHGDPGMKYYVSKQFFRYIRPGAQRIHVELSEEEDNLFVTAFEHADSDLLAIVLINASDRPIEATLDGEDVPDRYSYVITNPLNKAEQKDDADAGVSFLQ